MEEKLNAFGDIIEKIMQIALKIPDLLDRSLQDIISGVNEIQSELKTSFLDNTRKAPLEEKLNAFGDIIEKILQIVLKIPELVDSNLQDISIKKNIKLLYKQ